MIKMLPARLGKPLSLLILLALILLLVIWGYRPPVNEVLPASSLPPNSALAELCSKTQSYAEILDICRADLAVIFLGKSFDQIKSVLGEPHEQGYSDWLGPHYYLLYEFAAGPVRFCSPEDAGQRIAVSIFLGAEQAIMGAKVGMAFSEIEQILGTPAFGPALGMGNLFYMEYFLGQTADHMPEVFISFSAADVDGPTLDAFIKWEAFYHDNVEILL